MALTLDEKKAIVAEVAEVAADAYSVVAADYRGLSVADMAELRGGAREKGVYLRVVKNTLAARAVEGTEFEMIRDELEGPLVLAFSQEDPGSAARVLRDFAKDHDALELKFAAVGGQLYTEQAEIEQVAKLPTREEALTQLVATIQAPVSKLARTINEVPGKLVRTVAAIRDAKEAA